jgi:tRNA G10  N-methylase Trm11
MTYFFVLGNNPTISLMELAVILPNHEARLLGENFLIWESSHSLQPQSLIKKLGGVIKIGEIKKILPAKQDSQPALFGILKKANQNLAISGKFNFGFSYYGEQKLPTLAWGLELKKKLKEDGLSSRLVTSKETNLSSVVVEQNKLLTKGCELVVASDGGQLFIGQTLAVQAFKDLSKRDYGRPVRDDASGMLPPKLAQIMLNLAQINENSDLILDPFCGSGTVLQEALLLGAKNVVGTDISPKAIADTKENIAWLKEKYLLDGREVRVFLKNATKLSESFKPGQVTAIVTEPYLGPQRGWHDLRVVKEDLETLYTDTFKEFAKILPSGARVVMVWPSFFGNQLLKPGYNSFKIINVLPEDWQKWPEVRLTSRGTVIYGRSGQKVFREIVVLEKK